MLGYFVVEKTKSGIIYDAFQRSKPLPEVKLDKTIILAHNVVIFCNPIQAMVFLDKRKSGWFKQESSYTIYEVIVDDEDWKMVKELPECGLRSWLKQWLTHDGILVTEVVIASKLHVSSIKVYMDVSIRLTTIYGTF